MIAVVFSSTEIMVQWSDVPISGRNGYISLYEVLFEPLVQFDGQIFNESMITSCMNITLVNLQEYVTYNISVRAYNSAGAGPYSAKVTKTTLQDGKSNRINFFLCYHHMFC